MIKRVDKKPEATDVQLISQAKAAEMCGMTREAIQNLVRRGRFHSMEVEGRNLVYLEEVEAFVGESK